MFCHVPTTNVMAVHDCPSVYHVPLVLEKQGLLNVLSKRLGLKRRDPNSGNTLWDKWNHLTER